MQNKNLLPFVLIGFIITMVSCKKAESNCPENNNPPSGFTCLMDSPIDKGDRMMGIDLLNLTETGTFDNNLSLATELGMDFIALHVNWASLEPEPGVYTDPFNAITLLGQAAVDNGMKFSLTVRPIDLTGKTVPEDLQNERFNSIELQSRFQSLIDYIFTLVNPSTLLNLQIGNEIDGYDNSLEHEEFWSDYGSFLFESTQYAHSLEPELKVGYTATYHGLMGNQVLFSALNNAVDILGVTYYPLADSSFNTDSPDVVFDDFQSMVNAFPSIDIYLQEVGYQSSTICSSSESQQAEFYCNFFSAWDTHASRIKSAEIVRLNDISLSSAEEAAIPYGINSIGFIEYLRTLGLRTHDGEGLNKPAYDVIKENMEVRGW